MHITDRCSLNCLVLGSKKVKIVFNLILKFSKYNGWKKFQKKIIQKRMYLTVGWCAVIEQSKTKRVI